MKASYAELLELATGEGATTVELSPFSLALLLSVTGGSAAETFYWGELSQSERDAAEADLSRAVRELLTPKIGGENVPVGAIMPFAGEYPPSGWLWCNGGHVSHAAYPELWDVIHPNYKSILLDEIFLPDLRTLIPIGYSDPSWPVGFAGGEAMHILTEMEMPNHDHPRNPSGHTDETYVRNGTGGGSGYYTSNHPVITVSRTGKTGGGSAHNNMQPFHVVSGYIIRVKP